MKGLDIEPAGAYQFTEDGNDYVFTWAGGAIEIRLSHIVEGRGETTAELKATEDYQRHNHQDEQGFHCCLAFLIFPKTQFRR